MGMLGRFSVLLSLFVCATSAFSQATYEDDGYMGRNTSFGKLMPWERPTRTLDADKIYGIDVSKWQGTINWAVTAPTISFAVIRASYGSAGLDDKFAVNRAGAEAQNLPIGFYHYCYPQLNTAAAEADNFCNRVGTLKAGQFAVLDFEETVTSTVVQWCKDWLDAVYARLGARPLIYINLSINNSLNWSPVVSANYGLWLARWDENRDAAAPATDWPFCAMRQYSATQTIAGITGNVDGDTFYGNATQLKAYGALAPTATWTTTLPQTWYRSQESVGWSATGRPTLSTQRYVNGSNMGTVTTTTGTISLGSLPDNTLSSVYVRVNDPFGLNASTSPLSIGRDSVAPVINLTSGTPNTWYRTATNIGIQALDAKSGTKQVRYKWDNGAFSTWTPGTTLNVPLTQGKHVLTAEAEDNTWLGAVQSGNTSSAVLGEFWLDTAMPTLNLSARAVTAKTNATTVTITLANPNISPATPVTVDGLMLGGTPLATTWNVGSVAEGAKTSGTFTFPVGFGLNRSLTLNATVHIGSSVLNRTFTVLKPGR